MSLCYISNFQIIRPKHEKTQEAILQWIDKAHRRSYAHDTSLLTPSFLEDLTKIGLGPDKIQKRGIQFEDPLHENWESMDIFRLDLCSKGLGLAKRMEIFDQEVSLLFKLFYPENSPMPNHLIHVTCTGYCSPSGAQKIVSLRNSQHTQVTHAYHMGCYGSLPAIRIGAGFLKLSSQLHLSVDIVHTEMCTIHMDPSSHAKEQLIIQSLFADGFVKYSVTQNPNSPALQILAFQEEIIPDSSQDMSWICQDFGFCMHVSKEVPFKIANYLLSFLKRLSLQVNVPLEEILSKAIFAIHPGGPKIIEQTARLLKLQPFQFHHSLETLKSCGNMSSATLPHIWQSILEDPAILAGTFIVSLGFGPGLTLSAGFFQKHY